MVRQIVHRSQAARQHIDDQIGLGGPTAVERGLTGPGPGGDPLHGDGLIADLTEQREHCLGDCALQRLAAPAPGVSGAARPRHRPHSHGCHRINT
jgi:hypothetical protein